MTRHPKPYGVYFDEADRFNEGRTQGVHTFTAAILPNSKKAALEKKLLELQTEMTREVLRVAPHLAEHPRLADGRLIELHAVDLYQSGGIFREVKRVEPDFWPQQHEWMRQCLELSADFGVRYFVHMVSSAQHLESWGYKDRLAGSIGRYLKYKNLKARLTTLQKNPYFMCLPMALSQADDYLLNRHARAELFCHTYDEASNFATIKSYEVVQARGHYSSMKQAQFKTCTEQPLIQMADMAGYVILQHFYAEELKLPIKPEFDDWMRRYVLAGWQPRPHSPSLEKRVSISVMYFELLMTNLGGPMHFREAVERTLPDVINQMLTGDNRPIYLTDDGVILGEPTTNTPPTEEGGVYDQILPETGVEYKDEDENTASDGFHQ